MVKAIPWQSGLHIQLWRCRKINYIYTITNLTNGKAYVGKTNDPAYRKKKHFYLLENQKHFNRYLQNSYNKHGRDNFKFSVIDTLDKDKDWEELEKHHIKKLCSMYNENGYNISQGGLGGSFSGSERAYNSKISNQARVSNVVQVDKEDLSVVATYSSLHEASRETGIGLSAISGACNRIGIQASGFYWAFEEDYSTGHWKPTLDGRNRPVALIDDKENIVMVFAGMRVAEKELGISRTLIKERIEQNKKIKMSMDLKAIFISHDVYYNWRPEGCID